MNYSDKQVLDSLLNSDGKPASDMTSQLKIFGNGDMAAGIANVFEAGAAKGSMITVSIIGTIAIGGIAIKSIVDYCRTKKKLSTIPISGGLEESDECDSNNFIVAEQGIVNPRNENVSEE